MRTHASQQADMLSACLRAADRTAEGIATSTFKDGNWRACRARQARGLARSYNLAAQGNCVPQALLEDYLNAELSDGALASRRSMFGDRVVSLAAGSLHVVVAVAGSHGALIDAVLAAVTAVICRRKPCQVSAIEFSCYRP